MINKQKLWFLTLFSLILVLSVYYITMPSEILTASKQIPTAEEETNETVEITEADELTTLQIELDEERSNLAASYNEVLTSLEATTEEKNNAYEAIKSIDEIKSKEEIIKNKIKEQMKLSSFVKVDSNSVSIVIKNKEHDYSLANNIMRLAQEEFNNKMYISVRFQN